MAPSSLSRAGTPARSARGLPAWLQELILRSLEVHPRERHATAAQLAFDLQHPQQVHETSPCERTRRDGALSSVNRWIHLRRSLPSLRQTIARQLEQSP